MKKSRVLLIAIVLGVRGFSFAQNIVPNYSFEDTIKCGNGQFTGYVKNWTGWGAWGGGLTYFTPQCSGPGYEGGVPANDAGHQYAHTGVSYAGIYTFIDSLYFPFYSNARNYIQDSLLSPLVGGKKYYVSFFVSLGDTSKIACNNIGAYFSDSALVQGNQVKSYLHPQISNDIIHHPLTDKVNWMEISGSFVAAGGEQYIVIGNFVDDVQSDTTFVNSNSSYNDMAAYYYIDDVIVSTDSTYSDSLFTGVNEIKPVKASAKVYPNPANNLLNVAIAIPKGEAGYTMCLYNSEGDRVMCETLSNNVSIFSINQLISGIYYYRILDGEGNLVKSDKVTIIH